MSRAHVTALRSALAARIVAASTAAGSRVWPDRLERFDSNTAADGPAVAIYTPRENARRAGDAPIYDRSVNVELLLIVPGETTSAGGADALDALIDDVLTACLSDDVQDLGPWRRVESVDTDTAPQLGGDGAILYTVAQITITISGHVDFTTSVDDLDDLDTVNIDHDLGGDDTIDLVQQVGL